MGNLARALRLIRPRTAGYSVITPVLVTNHAQYLDVVPTDEKAIKEEESLITVVV